MSWILQTGNVGFIDSFYAGQVSPLPKEMYFTGYSEADDTGGEPMFSDRMDDAFEFPSKTLANMTKSDLYQPEIFHVIPI